MMKRKQQKWIHSVLKRLVDCDFVHVISGSVDWQRRGPVSHQWGQEPGVRPADGRISAATSRLHPAQHLQPHGYLLRLVPPQGQPLHAIPWVLPVRRGGRLCGEEREETYQGFLAFLSHSASGLLGISATASHSLPPALRLVVHKACFNKTTL